MSATKQTTMPRTERQREYDARYKAKHPERILASKIAYDEREGHGRKVASAERLGPEHRAAVHTASNARYPERRKARNAVNNAVRDGRLSKPDRCSRCQKIGPVEGSHDDYSRPLDVEWLCRPCHRAKDWK